MLVVDILLLLISFYLLAVIVDEFFILSLEEISQRLRLSSDVAGATFMAIGSSAPELFTAIIAVFRSGPEADIGSGTIVGSAIFNILVIIGASAIFKAARVNWQPVVRDTAFYSFSILMLIWTFWDSQVQLHEAGLLVITYGAYVYAVVNWRKWFPYEDQYAEDPIELLEAEQQQSPLARFSRKMLSVVIPDCTVNKNRFIGTFIMSIMGIGLLSYLLVESAVGIATVLHIHPAIVALTVLAAGTSIPDFLSSVAVAKQGRGDMAISNAVGSNIFNIFICLGLPWFIAILLTGETVPVARENFMGSVFLLFATVLAVFFMLYLRNWRIGKKAGWVLILIYILYLGWNISQVLL